MAYNSTIDRNDVTMMGVIHHINIMQSSDWDTAQVKPLLINLIYDRNGDGLNKEEFMTRSLMLLE